MLRMSSITGANSFPATAIIFQVCYMFLQSFYADVGDEQGGAMDLENGRGVSVSSGRPNLKRLLVDIVTENPGDQLIGVIASGGPLVTTSQDLKSPKTPLGPNIMIICNAFSQRHAFGATNEADSIHRNP